MLDPSDAGPAIAMMVDEKNTWNYLGYPMNYFNTTTDHADDKDAETRGGRIVTLGQPWWLWHPTQ